MSISIAPKSAKPSAEIPAGEKSPRRHQPPAVVDLNQPDIRLYIRDVLYFLRISKPTLYAGIKAGSLPKPDGHDRKRPFWLTQTIKAANGGVK
ncbi:hypothetical protein SAMN05443245_5849 [Paraburkholderia fungorum]|uniref:Uncharacterized protein n=1 Tax=Paraburkholderia fungorum TaxID=134537 RepID=A0A1H1IXR6_9BURK|nr:hypothetical protein [Paraburkholderia fungorum]SDR42473.1 hypothetical protein SAMN05443245_5849 [Paraburkholderia fungorum]